MADSEVGIGAITLIHTMEVNSEATQAKWTAREKHGRGAARSTLVAVLEAHPKALRSRDKMETRSRYRASRTIPFRQDVLEKA